MAVLADFKVATQGRTIEQRAASLAPHIQTATIYNNQNQIVIATVACAIGALETACTHSLVGTTAVTGYTGGSTSLSQSLTFPVGSSITIQFSSTYTSTLQDGTTKNLNWATATKMLSITATTINAVAVAAANQRAAEYPLQTAALGLADNEDLIFQFRDTDATRMMLQLFNLTDAQAADVMDWMENAESVDLTTLSNAINRKGRNIWDLVQLYKRYAPAGTFPATPILR